VDHSLISILLKCIISVRTVVGSYVGIVVVDDICCSNSACSTRISQQGSELQLQKWNGT